MGYTKTLRLRLLWVLGLNGSIGLLIAMSLWWLQNKGDLHFLPLHLEGSFIHSAIYGTAFGLGMPYLAERLGAFRSPWNWAAIAFSIAVLAVMATALVQLALLSFGLVTADKFWPEFGYKSITVFLIALIVALSVWGYERFRDQIESTNLQLRTQQLEKERALKLLTEARLTALESQLQPHFLFNTLNSISALIPDNPTLAEEMIQRLAALLRTSLDTRARSYIPLSEEVGLLLDYAEIEKARFGERLSLSIDVPPELRSLSIPPMILQPLVENSIKYAVTPRIEGAEIRVSVRKESEQLILSVRDDGPGFATGETTPGHSIENLKERLNNMFGNTAGVSVHCHAGGSAVIVSLPALNLIIK